MSNNLLELEKTAREAIQALRDAHARIERLTLEKHELMAENMKMAQLLVNARMEAEIAKQTNKMHGVLFGVDFAKGYGPQPQFSEDEIARLLRLCHPDKHGNSSAANEMTRKLLGLRKR